MFLIIHGDGIGIGIGTGTGEIKATSTNNKGEIDETDRIAGIGELHNPKIIIYLDQLR
tara:strand:- start:50 stop:223 length:174 start_codon:yes stop_codon:yes gene_type:complete